MGYEQELVNDVFTNGIIGPHIKMLGPVADGGRIVFITTPGCWGPMITPTLRGGHEVNVPVAIENADIGDAIAIHLEDIRIRSRASSSGVDKYVDGAYIGDPYVAKRCPSCREPWPEYEVVGIGQEAIRCKKCGAPASPFRMIHGYTMVFDENSVVGLTVHEDMAKQIAKEAWKWGNIPENSKQVPILIFGKADIVGLPTRLRPFVGQLGTTPAVDIPDSHNAGDFGYFLIDAPHPYRITKEQYERDLTDGHLDVDSVRKGAILIAPVKVKGGGVYAGDAHAMQGDGEVAGHTTDVSAEVSVKVEVIKGLRLDGPLLLPLEEDLPPLAKPWRKDEWEYVKSYAKKLGIEPEPVAPIQVIGSGPTINEAAKRGFERAAKLFNMKYEEVLNRVTITGAVEIGRLPGVVQVSLQVPIRILEKLGIADIVIKHYKLPY
ncbi:MAG: acetamidase/formamidase family protein [Staphylothermus sp.]|nr:acetamidase/formamidase family protein [Staphylothermus sp.]